MKRERLRSWTLALILCAMPGLASAYVYVRQAGAPPAQPQSNQSTGASVTWPDNRVEVLFALGGLDPAYIDSARSAMEEWNSLDTRLQMQEGSALGDVCDGNDNVNTIAWRTVLCGGRQFDDALAITVNRYQYVRGRWEITGVDIQINQTVPWQADRPGPMSGPVNDFRRVLLHELGHAFGLGHPDEGGQTVAAIMNSQVSDLDTLQDDDRAGITFLYGGSPNRDDGGSTSGGGGGGTFLPPELLALALLAARCRRGRSRRAQSFA